MARKQPSKELVSYLAEAGDKLSAKTKWVDHIFPKMVARWGMIEAIERLMVSGDIQPGFRKCIEVGLPEATFEAAVLKFPGEFSRGARESAQWRLDNALIA